ncbi:MAG: MYXO-CTERM sorting domain-containing protein [Myxococcota bacterium]|nr:MYXO-CTERM sorting domain-containing protein [Myxococcota bacterium]
MRVAILSVVLGLGATSAHAETIKQPIVWQNRVIPYDHQIEGPVALSNVSRKLYINDCKPNGCNVSPGSDSSLNNTSSIAQSAVVLPAYHHGQAHWDSLIDCVKKTFEPFTIEVVTTDPGNTVPHFEVMVGGQDTDLRPGLSAGGVAPYVSCGAQRSNGLSFVFPRTTADLEYLCGAVVQEATHVWGLDHELDAKDPMTYLQLGSLKRFQNSDANCGEDNPRNCRCGGTKQNSFKYMTNTFGLNPALAPAGIEIVSPKANAFVKPGFEVEVNSTGPVDLIKADIKVGMMAAGTATKAPYKVATPVTGLPIGKQTLTVSATDFAERPAMATVEVNVMGSCANGASCTDGTKCLGGVCYPNSDIQGGLGADCTTPEECATGSCIGDGTTMKCTAQCDPGLTCPGGFDCVETGGGAGVCWPSPGGEGGGCSTNGTPGSFALIGLGLALFALRRRRH